MHFLLAVVRSRNPQRLGRESDRGGFSDRISEFSELLASELLAMDFTD